MDTKVHTILVVEDDPDQLHILTDILTRAGYEVLAAYGAEPGFKKAKAHHPDLILTDLAMPQVSGVQLIEALRSDSETTTIPIIAVTAHVWEGIAKSAGTAGVQAFVSKPFNRALLLEEIAKHLPRSRDE